jgi:hypothetical protein
MASDSVRPVPVPSFIVKFDKTQQAAIEKPADLKKFIRVCASGQIEDAGKM